MLFVKSMPANLEYPLHAPASFQVRGIYEQVAYLGGGGQIVALQNGSLALTPISLALDGQLDFRDALDAGAGASLANGILRLGSLQIDLSHARTIDFTLHPSIGLDTLQTRIPQWRQLISTVLQDMLAGRSTGSPAGDPGLAGIGDLMLGLRDLQPLAQPPRLQDVPDVRGAFVRQLNAFLALAAAGGTPVGQRAGSIARIVGLGPGLTPSGDDFLIGLLCVLQSVSGAGDLAGTGFLLQLRHAIRGRLATTGAISAAFLREAVEGRFSERLRRHCDAFGRGDLGQARQLLEAIARTGHSSGTDTLGGMLLALNLSERRHPEGRGS